jgi:hypothetical protein
MNAGRVLLCAATAMAIGPVDGGSPIGSLAAPDISTREISLTSSIAPHSSALISSRPS